MKRILLISWIIVSAWFSLNSQVTDRQIITAMHSISSHDLLDYVKAITDDKYTGRLTGTREYRECAEWLAGFFQETGLEPGGENKTWYQEYDQPYTLIYPDCGLALHLKERKEEILKHYEYVSEFMPGSTSGNGEVTAEVVYAGYGITAPELDYDDYNGIDVKDKIIMIEREAPVSPSAGAEKFNPWYEYSFHQYKLQNAVKHGAKGMIYNYGPIGNPNNAYDENFIYIHVGDSVVKDIFAGTGKEHSEIINSINEKLKPRSFNTGKVVTIKMSTEHIPDGRGLNVIGLLPGTDPELRDETIIIGGHLDHLGKCYEIIPGANDNASAVAVMMGVAKALTSNNIRLKRSVLFLAFGSEEQALIGSKTYIEKPVFPTGKSVLLNMDGVGIGDRISITAGSDFPVLADAFSKANDKYVHRQMNSSSFPNLGRPRLDAAIFLRAGVPSLSFSTYGSQNYYHIPLDNIDIIKPEIMEDLAQILLIGVIELANSDSAIRQ